MTTITVDECRVRIVCTRSWVKLDRDLLTAAAQRIVTGELLQLLGDRAVRRGVSLAGSPTQVTMRIAEGLLHPLAQGEALSFALTHVLEAAVHECLSSRPILIERVTSESIAEIPPGVEPYLMLRVGTLSPLFPKQTRQDRRRPRSAHLEWNHESVWQEQELPRESSGPRRGRLVGALAGKFGSYDLHHSAPVTQPSGPTEPSEIELPLTGDVLLHREPLLRSDPQPSRTSTDIAQTSNVATDSDRHPRERAATNSATHTQSRTPSDSCYVTGQGALGTVRIRSVLPYLVLVSLDQLELLDAFVDAVGPDDIDLLPDAIAALARKILGPPPRGHAELHPSDLVVAGIADPHTSLRFELLERNTERFATVLDAVSAAVLCGRTDTESGLIASSIAGTRHVILADGDGAFPIRWGLTGRAGRMLWESVGSPQIEGDDRAVRILASAGVDPMCLIGASERAVRLRSIQRMFANNRIASWANLVELERATNVVAATGLADVAHRVFGALGPTDALQALTQFADLDGTVDFGESRVVVSMPVGRRHADLRDVGLLETIEDVPWLGGRSLELQGG